MSEAAAENDAVTVEYAIQQADGRIDPTPSEAMGLRLVKNDPRRVLLRRTVSPWERALPPADGGPDE